MGVMITTKDNPYDPRIDFNSWYAWDVGQGYNTCAYLDRVSAVAEDVPEVIREHQIEQAVDDMIERNGDLYQKLQVQVA